MNTSNQLMPTVNNDELLAFMKPTYTVQDINILKDFLMTRNVFRFDSLENGLFPAAHINEQLAYTNYGKVWVRDNVFIAYAHYICGRSEISRKTIMTLMDYFKKYQFKFERIISGEVDYNDPMNRPHVRFDGKLMQELEQKWAHAQNDALGYFLWFYCRLAMNRTINAGSDDLDVLVSIALYFQAISYWRDEDSGHWEENRKISGSSIGAAVAALRELKEYYSVEHSLHTKLNVGIVDELISNGEQALTDILPAECIQRDNAKGRQYDSALLFLIYPLRTVTGELADSIMDNVVKKLMGPYGIRRYLGDSYWCTDYKKRLTPENRTIDFSDNIASRNLLFREGEEAQWCIFDPIISIIHGLKFISTRNRECIELQTIYFNRSLGQITGRNSGIGEFLCPESYYKANGAYVPSDPTPLYWTQANLLCALRYMEISLNN